jgi:predicted  nucleic acid-binding Zn-ribbon protein
MPLQYVQASHEMAKQAQSLDLQHELLNAREEYDSLYEQNRRLVDRVAELERQLRDAAGQLQYREPWYYRTMPDGTEQGPFCGKCHDTRGLFVRTPLRHVGGGGEIRECPECRFHYWEREPRVDDSLRKGADS